MLANHSLRRSRTAITMNEWTGTQTDKVFVRYIELFVTSGPGAGHDSVMLTSRLVTNVAPSAELRRPIAGEAMSQTKLVSFLLLWFVSSFDDGMALSPCKAGA